jgi:beta-N-acetylhexosaminidase
MIPLFDENPPGGIVFYRKNLDLLTKEQIKTFLSHVSSLIHEKSGIKPFMGLDHEGGYVYRFSFGIASLPAPFSYWQLLQKEETSTVLAKIEEDSFISASEINSMGFNFNFAPVAEFLNDDNRIFLDDRSYGTDPVFTARAAASFVLGMERAGVVCAVKHFPGSAGADPHFSPSIITGDKNYLDSLVSPFTYLVQNGTRAVMVAHSLVPSLDSKIASLSSAVMEDWLRGEIGFNGLIITDDFTMTAAGNQNPETAAVMSIAAGADMILVWPQYLRAMQRAFTAALENGDLPRERLEEAATRVIYQKILLGLIDG